MPDQITTDENGKTYKNGVLQVKSNASPGISGAIKDAVGAVSDWLAPKSITQRKNKLAQQEKDAEGLGDEMSSQ